MPKYGAVRQKNYTQGRPPNPDPRPKTDEPPDLEAPLTEVELDPVVERRAEVMTKIDFDIYDKKNPHALVNKCDTRTAMMIGKIPQRWAHATEKQITDICQPDDTALRLRLAFWEEYNRAVRCNEKMDRGRLCYGICPESFWAKEVLNDWRMLAFIIRPPRQEMHLHKALMLHGYDRISMIINLPIQNEILKTTKDGSKTINTKYKKVDMAAIRAIRDTMRMLISTQQYYAVAQKFGLNEKSGGAPGRPARVRFPDQEVPSPDDPALDPQALEAEIEELEDLADTADLDQDLEDETDAIDRTERKPPPNKKSG